MLFNSPEFIFIFLPVTLLIYFLLTRRAGLSAKVWLVIASLFFYGWWKPEYLILILLSITVNYFLGKKILYSRSRVASRFSLITGIIFNVGLLVYFKYANFIVDNYNFFTGHSFGPFDIVLPLAISFFTFQQIAYLADCYGDHDKDYNFLDYSLFVTFFPQLIAGPIVHHKEMMPQFIETGNLKFISDNFAKGLFIFSLGLFKKMAIADTFSQWATAGFDSDVILTFFDAWAVSLSYTFQLYYDFSGYTDMAIGGALMFNIKLPLNFNSPYKALNIQDFWRRWHMTLSRWLRDYVYIPLGGSHCNQLRTSINLFLTFLIGGIWHGAGWTFVIWGALHGCALIIHRFWQKTEIKIHLALAWFMTFMFVNATWVFFRATEISDAGRIFRGMAGLNGFDVSPNFMKALSALYGIPIKLIEASNISFVTSLVTFQFIVFFGLIALLAPNTMELINHGVSYDRRFIYKRNASAAFISGIAAGIGALLLYTTTGSEFLYFNF
jgi:alginate O-acetyltransferase complex protein AlgI